MYYSIVNSRFHAPNSLVVVFIVDRDDDRDDTLDTTITTSLSSTNDDDDKDDKDDAANPLGVVVVGVVVRSSLFVIVGRGRFPVIRVAIWATQTTILDPATRRHTN